MSGNIESVKRLDRAFQEAGFDAIRDALGVEGEIDDLVQLGGPLGELMRTQVELIDPEVEVDTSTYRGGFPGKVRWQGAIGWLDFWREWLAGWDDFAFESTSHEEVGAHVVRDTILRARGRTSGTPVEWRQIQVWTFRDGKIIGVRLFENRAEAMAWIRLNTTS